MLFTVASPADTPEMSAYRARCHAAIARIDMQRRIFLEGAPARGHLAGKSPAEMRMAFGAILMGANILSANRVLPGAFPGQFMDSLASAIGQGDTPADTPFRELQERRRRAALLLAPVLSAWPDFDIAAYRAGKSQGDPFLNAFSDDFKIMRNIVFDLHATNQAARLGADGGLQMIFDQFQAASFGPINPQAFEDYLAQAQAAAEEAAAFREPSSEF